MNNDVVRTFMIEINDLRFLTPDELYENKEKIRKGYSKLRQDYKEIYKWYFFTQLCLLRNPLKYLFWDYVNGRNNLIKLNKEYTKFCKKREQRFKKQV